MSLIQRGRGLVKMGTAGLAQNAQLEAAENRTRQQIDDAKKAGQMQMIGQGGGVGAMYGINSARTAGQGITGALAAPGQTLAGTSVSTPIGSTLVPPPVVLADGTVSVGLQGVTNSGVSVAQGMELAGITSGATTGGAATGGAAVGGATAGGATTLGAATGTAGAGAAGAGAAGAGAAGAGAGATAASTPILSTMATIAAPIAIGLGVAYLISELFD